MLSNPATREIILSSSLGIFRTSMSKRSKCLRLLRSPRNQVVNRVIYLIATIILRLSLNNTFTKITIQPQGHRRIPNPAVGSTIRSLSRSPETKFNIHPYRSTIPKKAIQTRIQQTIQRSPNNPLGETSFNSTKSTLLNNNLIITFKRKRRPH